MKPVNLEVAKVLAEDFFTKSNRALASLTREGMTAEVKAEWAVALQAMMAFEEQMAFGVGLKAFGNSLEFPVPEGEKNYWSEAISKFDEMKAKALVIQKQIRAATKSNDIPDSAATFLDCQQWVLKNSRRPDDPALKWHSGEEMSPSIRSLTNEWMSLVYGDMRMARVFDVDMRTYASLYHTADVYVTEKLGKAKWIPENLAAQIVAGESDQVRAATVAAGRTLPMPEPLPFPQVFFSFGKGVPMKPQQVFWHLVGNEAGEKEFMQTGISLGLLPGQLDPGANDFHDATWRLMGFLVTATGMVVGFLEAAHHPSKRKGLVVQTYHFPVNSTNFSAERAASLPELREWSKVYSLVPWVITSLVAVVNAHRTFIEQDMSLSYRMNYTQHAKRTFDLKKPIPPPYYQVHLKDQLVRDATRKSLRSSYRWHLAHRFDVRGHERIKVSRGTLPLDPKIQHKLEKRKYVIFTLEEPDVEAYRLLMQRGFPHKRPDEWLAIKRCWVNPFLKGPVDAPYIPSVRTVPMKRVR